jgi:hypothetical protein
MRIMQLIYHSRPFGYDAATLDDILGVGRKHNRLRGITGALLCRSDLYVQLLEGPREAVTRTFARILEDERHSDVTLVWCADALARLFPEWDMRDDPPRSWMWSREQVAAGVAREAGAGEFRDLFDRLAREERQAPVFAGQDGG